MHVQCVGVWTWVCAWCTRELGILWTDDAGRPHSLHLVARGGKESSRGEEGFLARAVLDGEPLPVPNTPGAAVTDEAWGFSFTFMGTSKKGPYDVDRYAVRTPVLCITAQRSTVQYLTVLKSAVWYITELPVLNYS